MKRIAFIHDKYPAGGAERITRDIAQYLSGFGGDYMTYAYITELDRSLLTEEDRKALNFRIIDKDRTDEIIRFIKEDKIDILTEVTWRLHGIREIKEKTGCKVVFACHEEPFWHRHLLSRSEPGNFFKKILYRSMSPSRKEAAARKKSVKWTRKDYLTCDAFRVLCDEYGDIIRREFGIPAGNAEKDRIVTIENPEYTVSDINYEKEKIFLFSGRLENFSKRVDRLLRIWRKVQDRLPEWRLLIAGDGRDADELKALAEELGLQRAEFIGMQKDMKPLYRKASAVLLTSQTEGWPLCLTEAQAHGCIAVAFGCTAGVREILSPDWECGITVPPFDEDRYAEALIGIAGMEPERAMAMRKASVAKRALYSPEIISEKWKKLFDSLA